MHREVGANGIRMPDVEKQGRHSRETEVFDQALRGVEADVTKGHLIVPAFGQKAGNQRSDLSSTQDEHTLHGTPHLRSVYSRRSRLRKTFLHNRILTVPTSTC